MTAKSIDMDMDQVVDYRAEYSQAIKKHTVSGSQLNGLCPFHDDRESSFSVNLQTGQYTCFACGASGNFTTFWAETHGTDTEEAYRQIMDRYGVDLDGEDAGKKPKGTGMASYSLKEYSLNKQIPEEWLSERCRMETARDRDGGTYLKIPYYDESGDMVTFRKRYGNKQFRWKYGSSGRITLYGAWLLPEIRKAGYAAIVEGESDTQTLLYMNIPVLGVAGASLFKEGQAAMLQDLKLYLHKEPDRGGDTFLTKMTTRLRDGGFIGEVYVWSCGQFGVKDPSELYIRFGKEAAVGKIQKALKTARKIDLDHLDGEIPEAIKGAPVSLRQTEGWMYSEKGICRIDEKQHLPKNICRTPIIITQRLKSIERPEEKIEVAFKRDGAWHRAIYPRSTIFTSKGITALADLGCTVTSENAKDVVQFLSALESENIDIIQKADSTTTFGWQPGKRFLPGHGSGIVLDVDPTQKGLVSAYGMNGSLEGWVAQMAPHRSRDKFRFILAASFTAPLLRIIRQRIFFVYNWGGSKGGKSAAVKAALSAWGEPERLMVNFNATAVGLERLAAFYCDLPLGIDERQLAGQKQGALEQIVYMISSGTGKIRGAKNGGIQETKTWRTVALANGEEPLATETSQTGVSTRTLEIYGGPFDDEQEASIMHQTCAQNCGWAGPGFVGRLMGQDEDDIRQRYDGMLRYVNEKSDGRSGSHIACIAAVALADAMLDEWIFHGEDSGERARRMAERILQEQMTAAAGDVNENATQFIVDWIMSNKANFGERAVGTCLGFMDGKNAYIFPSLLNQALTKAGYSPRKTMRYLGDNGLIAATPKKSGGKEYTKPKWFDNRTVRFVEFHLWMLAKEKDPLLDEDGIAGDISGKDGFRQVSMGDDVPFDGEERLPYE